MARIELLQKGKLKTLRKKVKEAMEEYNSWRTYDSDLLYGMEYRGPLEMAVYLIPCLKEGCTLLDVGCGTGLNGVYYKDTKNCVITGVDISDESLKRAAKKKVHGKNVYSFLKQADLEERLDFPDKSFDAVLCVGVFEYFKNIEHVVKEMSRVSKRIVAFDANTTRPSYLHKHSRGEVMATLKKANLELLEEYRHHSWTTPYGKGLKRIFTIGVVSKKK